MQSHLHSLMTSAGLLASIVYSAWLSRQTSLTPQRLAATLSTASLVFLTHLTYDYVFLAIPLAASLRAPFDRARIQVAALIVLFWWGLKLIPPDPSRSMQIVFSTSLFLLNCFILHLVSTERFVCVSLPLDTVPADGERAEAI